MEGQHVVDDDTLTSEQVKWELDELAAVKDKLAKRVEKLLAQRADIDASLKMIGYKKPRVRSTPKPTAKKRGRPAGSRNTAKATEAILEATA